MILLVIVGAAALRDRTDPSDRMVKTRDFEQPDERGGFGVAPDQHDTSRTGQVVFPDGESIAIDWRDETNPILFPEPPFARHYAELRERAIGGNTTAAFVLYAILDQCRKAFSQYGDVEAATESLLQTRTVRLPDRDEPRRVLSEDGVDILLRQINVSFQICSGIDDRMKSEADEWLARSAKGGMSIALMEYARTLPAGEQAIRLYEAAWQTGDAEALGALADQYQHQYDIGNDPRADAKAYAALAAYTFIVEAAMGAHSGHGPIARRQLQRTKNRLHAAGARLHGHEIEEALSLAKEIVRQNDDCCYGM